MPTAVPKKASASSTRNKRKEKPSHPSYLQMIAECILEYGDASGVSRQMIKKFVEDHYGLSSEQKSTKNAIAKAINSGVNHDKLVQPKGFAGKVKLSTPFKKEYVSEHNGAAKPHKETATKKRKTKHVPEVSSEDTEDLRDSDEDDSEPEPEPKKKQAKKPAAKSKVSGSSSSAAKGKKATTSSKTGSSAVSSRARK